MLLVKNKRTGNIFEVGTNDSDYTTITRRAYELAKSKYSIVSGVTAPVAVKKNEDAGHVERRKPGPKPKNQTL